MVILFLIIETIEIHATINAKRMYELFGFIVKSEIHDDYDGDVYIMEYCHSSVSYYKHSDFCVCLFCIDRLFSTSTLLPFQFQKYLRLTNTYTFCIHLSVTNNTLYKSVTYSWYDSKHWIGGYHTGYHSKTTVIG